MAPARNSSSRTAMALALDDPARRWLPELAEPRDFWAAVYAAIDG